LYKEPEKKLASPEAIKTAPALVTKESLRRIFTHPEILKLGVASMLIVFAEMAAITHTALFMKDVMLYSAVLAGVLLAWAEGGGAVTKVGVGFISDRLFQQSRKKPFIVLASAAFVCTVIAAFLDPDLPVGLIYALWAVLGIGLIGWTGLNLALVGEFAGTELTGIATGFNFSIVLIGSIAGPPVFGFIVDKTNSYTIAWLAMAGCLLIAILLLSMIRETRRIV
jgi:sugar phosphate permease